jgi:hypothetical protein
MWDLNKVLIMSNQIGKLKFKREVFDAEFCALNDIKARYAKNIKTGEEAIALWKKDIEALKAQIDNTYDLVCEYEIEMNKYAKKADKALNKLNAVDTELELLYNADAKQTIAANKAAARPCPKCPMCGTEAPYSFSEECEACGWEFEVSK